MRMIVCSAVAAAALAVGVGLAQEPAAPKKAAEGLRPLNAAPAPRKAEGPFAKFRLLSEKEIDSLVMEHTTKKERITLTICTFETTMHHPPHATDLKDYESSWKRYAKNGKVPYHLMLELRKEILKGHKVLSAETLHEGDVVNIAFLDETGKVVHHQRASLGDISPPWYEEIPVSTTQTVMTGGSCCNPPRATTVTRNGVTTRPRGGGVYGEVPPGKYTVIIWHKGQQRCLFGTVMEDVDMRLPETPADSISYLNGQKSG